MKSVEVFLDFTEKPGGGGCDDMKSVEVFLDFTEKYPCGICDEMSCISGQCI